MQILSQIGGEGPNVATYRFVIHRLINQNFNAFIILNNSSSFIRDQQKLEKTRRKHLNSCRAFPLSSAIMVLLNETSLPMKYS